jgi:alpha-beta hydrolase superfamily lysophospholipase
MLNAAAREIARAESPVALVGSSLGAFVALHAADRDPGKVGRMVLLAPAFDFGGNRLRQLGEHGIDEWRTRGRLSVFHYADNKLRDVGFELYEDAARYDAFAVTPRVPTLIFQGRQDASVDPAMVERWARERPGVTLRMLDDDHQLTASVDLIWNESRSFFEL